MKRIIKQKIPKALLSYQSTPNASYDGFQEKNALRIALIEEQKGLCAYCNSRISNDWDNKLGKYKTEIEHYKSQELHPELQLDYNNMLGVCNGNSGNKPSRLHCDKSRPEQSVLTLTPLSKNHENLIKYSSTGEIYSDNKAINHDLHTILNLNVDYLKKNREQVLFSTIARMNRNYPKKPGDGWTKREINSELAFWESLDKNKNHYAYCHVAIFYLKNKLKYL